jgi:glycosyltransferase involved in cell wall biosynthesis
MTSVSHQPSDDHPLAGRTILQIIPRLDAGGAERTTVDIVEAIVKAGGRAMVATEGGRLVEEVEAKGGEWIDFPAATKNPLAILANVGRLKRLIARENIDIVHARSRAPAWSAFFATRGLKIPFVTTYHGSYSGTSAVKILYNSVMARGDVVIANSHYTAGLIAGNYPFAVPRIEVIHRGTDMQRFSPEAVAASRIDTLRRAWGVPDGARIVLLAARLTGWKGQHDVIDAMALLRDRGLDDVIAIFAGDAQGRDAYVADLNRHIASCGLEGRVRLVGHCADMPAAFRAASVVAVASTEPEAFGRSAVEAQALGRPVVVTDLGAVPETVIVEPEDRRTGWRVPPRDPPALAQALYGALMLEPASLDALVRRARGHVETQFSLETMTGATIAVYQRCLIGKKTLHAF